jgi:multiple sugar transport system substrate-binding protein
VWKRCAGRDRRAGYPRNRHQQDRNGAPREHNSAFTDNPDGSLAFAEYLITEPVQKEMFIKDTLPAVATAVYKDPQVKKEIPFTEELLKAVEQAQARPVSPVYTEISEAIYNNVFEVLNGRESADSATSKMNSEIEGALQRF